MPLSEFYESTIIKASAGFGYAYFNCDPDEITAILGVTPDQTMRKGEEWVTAVGKPAIRPFNSWSIGSRAVSKDVNVHIRELLERLGDRYGIARCEWGKASFGITWKNNYLHAGTGPFYEADVLHGITLWNAELFQDIYYIEQEIDEAQSGEGLRRISKDELRKLFKNDG